MIAALILFLIASWSVYRISKWDKPPKGKHERVKLVRVIDGDTYEFKRNSGEIMRVRLRGCDTPELKSGDKKAVIAKNTAEKLLTDCEIDLYDLKIGGDKYGRSLATVFAGGVDVAKYLVKHGLAYEYHGGSKRGKRRMKSQKIILQGNTAINPPEAMDRILLQNGYSIIRSVREKCAKGVKNERIKTE